MQTKRPRYPAARLVGNDQLPGGEGEKSTAAQFPKIPARFSRSLDAQTVKPHWTGWRNFRESICLQACCQRRPTRKIGGHIHGVRSSRRRIPGETKGARVEGRILNDRLSRQERGFLGIVISRDPRVVHCDGKN